MNDDTHDTRFVREWHVHCGLIQVSCITLAERLCEALDKSKSIKKEWACDTDGSAETDTSNNGCTS